VKKPKTPTLRPENLLGAQFVKDGGIVATRTQFVGHGREVIMLAKYGGHYDTSLKRCEILAPSQPVHRPTAADPDRMRSPTKWLGMAYDFSGRIEGCLFAGPIQEHALYIREAGNVVVRSCYFDSMGSQAIQTLWRNSESYRTPDQDISFRIERCTTWQCTRPDYGERPGFTFGAQGHPTSGFVVYAPIMLAKFDPFTVHGVTARSFGAILSKQRPWTEIDGGPSRLRSVVDYTQPDRPVLQIEKPNGPVTIRRMKFARKGKLALLGTGNTPIRIENCSGPVTIVRDGKVIGPIEKGYSQ